MVTLRFCLISTDYNEYPPKFTVLPTSIEIPEDAPGGSLVTTIVAEDDDLYDGGMHYIRMATITFQGFCTITIHFQGPSNMPVRKETLTTLSIWILIPAD